MSDFAKNLLMWIVIAMVLMSVFNYYSQPQEPQVQEMTYSMFLEEVRGGVIDRVQIQESAGAKSITAFTRDGRTVEVLAPRDDGLIKDLLDNRVEIEAKEPERRSLVVDILISLLPVLVLVGLWVYFMRQMQGGMGGRGGAMSFGKSRAKLQGEDQV